MMRQLLIVTHIDFWRGGSGHRTRLSSVVAYLQDKVKITVVYAGLYSQHDEATLRRLYPGISVEVLERERTITYQDYRLKFESYIVGRTFDFALVEYIEMSFVLPYLQPDVITLLDTHDIVHDRIKSFQKKNLHYDGIFLTREEEFEIFNCFDYVIVIQQDDYTKVNAQMMADRILLVPHPIKTSKKLLRTTVRHIGYVASGYSPNIDALTWFLTEVWQMLYGKHNIVLDVYGGVCEKLSDDLKGKSAGVNFHGFVEDLDEAYNTCDIIVNPVRCGAGLKIKNVEAMGHGLPLITTSHGAIGIDDELNVSFLLADTAEDFKLAIEKLVDNYEYRASIGNNAFNYVQRYFSHERCFKPLLDVMLV